MCDDYSDHQLEKIMTKRQRGVRKIQNAIQYLTDSGRMSCDARAVDLLMVFGRALLQEIDDYEASHVQ